MHSSATDLVASRRPGTTAWTEASREVDTNVKDAAKAVFEELRTTHKELSVEPNLSGDWVFEHLLRAWAFEKVADFKEHAQDSEVKGSSPDGMVFFHRKVPIAVFEAKKQGEGGNAIERWYKNYFVYILQG
ncbi:MAG: hypothetical protein LC097_05405 [Burkholderiales bacterium]|nr:hypothetical protein [Burkholderiales bacterium]